MTAFLVPRYLLGCALGVFAIILGILAAPLLGVVQ